MLLQNSRGRSPYLPQTDNRAPSWSCAVCGADLDLAIKCRARLSLPTLTANFRTCTPACSRIRALHIAWRCASCGCKWEEAAALRRRLGLRRLRAHDRACSPTCSHQHSRERRIAKLRRAKDISIPDPFPSRSMWRCSECGISHKAAAAKRKRLGLPPFRRATQPTCSPACQKARDLRRHHARLAAMPPSMRGRRPACGAIRPPPLAGDVRPRSLQEGERHVRAHGRRPRAQDGRLRR